MEEKFAIRGIVFTREQLQPVSFEVLKSFKLCPGHLYLFSKIHQRPIFMLQAGDVIDEKFIQRYQSAGIETFHILPIVDSESVEKYKFHFENLKNSKFENLRWSERNQIVDLFRLKYIYTKKNSFLEFALATHQIFDKLPKEIINSYINCSDILTRRAYISASFSVLFALSLGYVDFQFLQDIYHIAFLRDFGLVEDEFNYSILKACEMERIKPGSGKSILKTKSEVNFFLSHPLSSAKKIEKLAGKIFNYTELIKSVEFHHELSNKQGFPRGVNYLSLSDYEAIVNLTDYLIPFEEIVFSKEGDYQLLQLIQQSSKEKIIDQIPVKRVVELLVAIYTKGLENEVVEA